MCASMDLSQSPSSTWPSFSSPHDQLQLTDGVDKKLDDNGKIELTSSLPLFNYSANSLSEPSPGLKNMALPCPSTVLFRYLNPHELRCGICPLPLLGSGLTGLVF